MLRMLNRELTILQYHHVGIPSPRVRYRSLYVTPAQFDWQLRQFQRLPITWMTFRDLLNHENDAADSAHRMMITFDDGSSGVYEHAFPLLRKYGIPAVVYPVIGDLGKKQVVWQDSTDKTPLDIISAEQVREMSEQGIEFGTHLYNHARAHLLSAERLREELTTSKVALEAIVRQDVLSIAYPFGNYNQQVLDFTRDAGYRFGVISRPGSNIGQNMMELYRTPIRGTRWYHRLYVLKFLASFKFYG